MRSSRSSAQGRIDRTTVLVTVGAYPYILRKFGGAYAASRKQTRMFLPHLS